MALQCSSQPRSGNHAVVKVLGVLYLLTLVRDIIFISVSGSFGDIMHDVCAVSCRFLLRGQSLPPLASTCRRLIQMIQIGWAFADTTRPGSHVPAIPQGGLKAPPNLLPVK